MDHEDIRIKLLRLREQIIDMGQQLNVIRRAQMDEEERESTKAATDALRMALIEVEVQLHLRKRPIK